MSVVLVKDVAGIFFTVSNDRDGGPMLDQLPARCAETPNHSCVEGKNALCPNTVTNRWMKTTNCRTNQTAGRRKGVVAPC